MTNRRPSRPAKPARRPQPPREPAGSPNQPESPPESRNGHEEPSEGSWTASSAAEFVTEPGPDFDPEHSPDPPELEEEDLLAEPGAAEFWTEEQIRGMLVIQGNLTHAILKVGPEDADTWKQTEEDLGQIAPPLTRILNRYDMTRAAAAAGDEVLLSAALLSYGAKNYTRRKLLLARQAAQEPQPASGVPAPPGTGPETDPEWQRAHVDHDLERPAALTPKGARRR